MRKGIAGLPVLIIGIAISVAGHAQDSGAAVTQDSSMVKDAMEATGEAIKKAADGTERAWESTKEGAKKAADYTGEKADQAWEATKQGT